MQYIEIVCVCGFACCLEGEGGGGMQKMKITSHVMNGYVVGFFLHVILLSFHCDCALSAFVGTAIFTLSFRADCGKKTVQSSIKK